MKQAFPCKTSQTTPCTHFSCKSNRRFCLLEHTRSSKTMPRKNGTNFDFYGNSWYWQLAFDTSYPQKFTNAITVDSSVWLKHGSRRFKIMQTIKWNAVPCLIGNARSSSLAAPLTSTRSSWYDNRSVFRQLSNYYDNSCLITYRLF